MTYMLSLTLTERWIELRASISMVSSILYSIENLVSSADRQEDIIPYSALAILRS